MSQKNISVAAGAAPFEMGPWFALTSSKGRHLGGALYRSRKEAEDSLAELRTSTTYDGIVELALVQEAA